MTAIFRFYTDTALVTAAFIGVMFMIRFLFRKRPASQLFLIWVFVLARLLVPVRIGDGIHIDSNRIPEQVKYVVETSDSETSDDSRTDAKKPSTASETDFDVAADHNPVSTTYTHDYTPADVMLCIWITGILAFVFYFLVSMHQLRKRTNDSISIEKNIHRWNGANACVVGIFRPQIYVPVNCTDDDLMYVIRHEKAHIAHGDNIFVLLFFIALSLNWYNPLAWIAYHFAIQDMEMDCDERVLSVSTTIERKEYARALVSFYKETSENYLVTGFGGKGIMNRVKNIGEQKKTKKPVTMLIVLVCCIALGISALVYLNRNPAEAADKPVANTNKPAAAVDTTEESSDTKAYYVPEFPDDPFMSCIYKYTEKIGSDLYSTYVIPAPSIYWIDEKDKNDIRVYCNLWSYGYQKKGNILFSESGGECPGRLHIKKSDTGRYEVTSFDRVGDGANYAKDISRICQDAFEPKWVEKMYYEDTSKGTYRDYSRMVILAKYIQAHSQLSDVKYYQDNGWDPVKIEPVRRVYVNDALYEDTGRFDLITCDTGVQELDKVTKNGADPTVNGQTNFRKTQYLGKSDDEIDVKVNHEYYVFHKC